MNRGGDPERVTCGKRQSFIQRHMMPRRKKPNRSAIGACTKYTLFTENFLVLIIGIACTALATYMLVLKKKTITEYHEFLLDPACLMCAVGSIVTVMGFLGSVGSLRENTCCLKTYYYLLCLFLLGELVIAILAFVAYYQEGFQEKLFPTGLFNDAILNYRDDLDTKNMLDGIQRELGCCGMSNNDEGFKDWNKNVYFNCTLNGKSPERCSVPQSCCRVEDGQMMNLKCGANIYSFVNGKRYVSETGNIYTQGCIKALGDWIENNALVIGGVLLGILLPQVFIVILSRNLIDMITAQKSRW